MASVNTRASMPAVCLPIEENGPARLMQRWQVTVRGWEFDIPEGTLTDGASIPRFLWRICGHPLVSPRVYAALMHDWLYGNDPGCPAAMTRKEADLCYRQLLEDVGWGKFRSGVEYRAIRMFGAAYWTDRGEQQAHDNK